MAEEKGLAPYSYLLYGNLCTDARFHLPYDALVKEVVESILDDLGLFLIQTIRGTTNGLSVRLLTQCGA